MILPDNVMYCIGYEAFDLMVDNDELILAEVNYKELCKYLNGILIEHRITAFGAITDDVDLFKDAILERTI